MELLFGMPSVRFDAQTPFSPLQYKVMMSGELEGFLPGRRAGYNGEDRLLYQTQGKISLSGKAEMVTREEAAGILCTLARCIKEICGSGYLHIGNLVMDPDWIFAEKNGTDGRIWLIYLPVDPAQKEEDEAEKEVRSLLIRLLCIFGLDHSFEGRVCLNYLKEKKADASEASSFVLDALRHIGAGKEGQAFRTASPDGAEAAPGKTAGEKTAEEKQAVTGAVLESMSPIHKIRLSMEGSRLVIGRDFVNIHGQNERVSTVSARHCEISINGGKLYVKDLRSTNGTFINGRAAAPEKSYELKDKDLLGIANVPFLVRIKRG